MSSNVSNLCVGYSNIETPSSIEIAIKLLAYNVVFIVAFFGNILAISVVLSNVHLKTTTNVFILNLAISDLLIAIVCMPSSMHSIVAHSRQTSEVSGIFGAFLCKLHQFLQGISITSSILTVACIGCDRFLAIVYPFKNIITLPISKIIVALVWFASIACISPLLYALKFHDAGNESYCYEKWEPLFDTHKASVHYTLFLFVVQYAAPLLLITVLYSTLIKDLWQSSRTHSDRKRAYKENKAVLKMLVTIILTFAIFWLPMHVVMFVSIYTTDPVINACGPKAAVVFLGWFLGHAHSACNPTIYFTFNEKFRIEIRKLMAKVKSWFVSARQQLSVDDETTRQTAVSFDLKRVSFTSLRSNGKFNPAVELKDEDKQENGQQRQRISLGESEHVTAATIPLAPSDHVRLEVEKSGHVII